MGRRVANTIAAAGLVGIAVSTYTEGALPHPDYLIATALGMIAAVLVWK